MIKSTLHRAALVTATRRKKYFFIFAFYKFRSCLTSLSQPNPGGVHSKYALSHAHVRASVSCVRGLRVFLIK